MYHRRLQVSFQDLNDIQSAPTGSQHVDGVGALVSEEAPFDVRIDLFGRQFLHFVERYLDPLHAAHGEARVGEIFSEKSPSRTFLAPVCVFCSAANSRS
jgi:hypothetical protein